MTQIDVTFSNQVNATQADNTPDLPPDLSWRQGTSAAAAEPLSHCDSASYSPTTETVTLTPEEAVRAQGPWHSSSRSRERRHQVSRTSPGALSTARKTARREAMP